jgi:ectoine hydroxylase-related dioxygenase (phytanoyl-CoA dioxygenase family)
MIQVDCRTEQDWLAEARAGLRYDGFCVVTGVLDEAFVSETRDAMYSVQEQVVAEVGTERLDRAGELGVLRLMLKYDQHFFRLLALEPVLSVVDATVSETAVLHLQNGLILPPVKSGDEAELFQRRFHQDFPRVLNGFLISINTFFALEEFTAENGGTQVVPGTHQRATPPSQRYLEQQAVSVECPAGSMIIFDSTLWHAAGENRSGADRLAVNQQFTRSYVKQQVDYVRALGDEVVLEQPPRTQQLLGWYTRVVTSLDEFYRPAEERLYRSGQG